MYKPKTINNKVSKQVISLINHNLIYYDKIIKNKFDVSHLGTKYTLELVFKDILQIIKSYL